MKLPKNIQKSKDKNRDPQTPRPVGGDALERLHQFEQERGLPESQVDKCDHDDSKEHEKRNKSD